MAIDLARDRFIPLGQAGADDDECFEPDYDEPITGAWLAAAFDAIFVPLEREDIDLMFDPDDYPVR